MSNGRALRDLKQVSSHSFASALLIEISMVRGKRLEGLQYRAVASTPAQISIKVLLNVSQTEGMFKPARHSENNKTNGTQMVLIPAENE